MLETKYDPNCVSYAVGTDRYLSPEEIIDLTAKANSATANVLVTFDKQGRVLHVDKYDPKKPRQLDGRCGDSGEIIIFKTPVTEEMYPDGSLHTQFRRLKPVEQSTPTSHPA